MAWRTCFLKLTQDLQAQKYFETIIAYNTELIKVIVINLHQVIANRVIIMD